MDNLRSHIECQIAQQDFPTTLPLPTKDPFLASSCLHKAMRRGERTAALSSALALLAIDPERLWKRLSIIVLEDFGLADLSLTGQVIAAASSKAWRSRVGGDVRTLSYLIDRLSRCPRDRRATELYVLALSLEEGSLASLPPDAVISDALLGLMEQARTALRECERLTVLGHRSMRSTVPKECDRTLQGEADHQSSMAPYLPMFMQARRTTQVLLPLTLAFWVSRMPRTGPSIVHREAPPTLAIHGIPSCGLDGFTRIGKEALSRLAREDRALSSLIQPLPSSRARSYALAEALFEVESGICTAELFDDLYSELRRWSIGCRTRLPARNFADLMEAMKAALPRLNEIRGDLYVRNLR